MKRSELSVKVPVGPRVSRDMHRNPVKRGPVLKSQQWEWGSLRSFAYKEPA